MDEQISRAMTDLKRAGIDPLEFALATVEPQDIQALAGILLTQAGKLVKTAGVETPERNAERIWVVLQEYIKALGAELGKHKPDTWPGLVHFDGYFLQTQERNEPAFRNWIRAAFARSGSNGQVG